MGPCRFAIDGWQEVWGPRGIIGERGRYGANIVAMGDIWVTAATGDKSVGVQRREKGCNENNWSNHVPVLDNTCQNSTKMFSKNIKIKKKRIQKNSISHILYNLQAFFSRVPWNCHGSAVEVPLKCH